MSYTKQTFIDNETVLTAEHLNHIEDGIEKCVTMEDIDTLFVSTDPQTLSSDQKARARENIGAASIDDIGAGSGGIYVGSGEMPEGYVVQIDPDGDDIYPGVTYTSQTLSEEQKAQARANIGAATVAEVLAALPKAEEVSF